MQLSALKSNINRAPLKDQVQDILMTQILSGELKPGDRLKEIHIAKSLGVSQGPVREAIRSLEAIGYVEHVPNVGAKVKIFNIDKLMEVYQVREALEIMAAKIAIDRRKDPSELNERAKVLEDAFHMMKAAAEHGDALGYAKFDTQFHRSILEMSGNPTLLEVWESLAIQSSVLHTMFGKHLNVDNTNQLHAGIISGFRKGDKATLLDGIRKHFELIRHFHI